MARRLPLFPRPWFWWRPLSGLAASPTVEFGARPPGRFHENAACSSALVSRPHADGDVRHFRGGRIVGRSPADKVMKSSRHARGTQSDQLRFIAGNCVAASRRISATSHGRQAIVHRKPADDRSRCRPVSSVFRIAARRVDGCGCSLELG